MRPHRRVLAQHGRLASSGGRAHLHQLAAPQFGPRDVEPFLVAQDAVVSRAARRRRAGSSGRGGLRARAPLVLFDSTAQIKVSPRIIIIIAHAAGGRAGWGRTCGGGGLGARAPLVLIDSAAQVEVRPRIIIDVVVVVRGERGGLR